MYCPKCGTENPDDAQLCRACGFVLPKASLTSEDKIPKISGLAIASFVLGILSILFFPIGLIAIILGIVSIVIIEKSGGRITGRIFAVVGIIVPVLVFFVTFILLIPALQRVKEQARAVACMANLKQWSLLFAMYTQDHDGYFFSGEGRDNGRWWTEPLQTYHHNDTNLFLCPTATKPYNEGGQNPFGAWTTPEGNSGSYALNGWICNPKEGETNLWGRGPIENYLRTPNIKRANNIPIFSDCMWFEGWPRQDDSPPPVEDWLMDRVNENEMKANQNELSRFCVNRHQGYVNCLFMDYSVRKVGLKELWTLKWHRQFDTSGPRTRKGGVRPNDWPQWMRNLKDY
jgi:hypothetical protein